MILSSVSNNNDILNCNIEFKKVMVLLEKAGKDKDSRLASSLTK
jgi:hypothetical protein